MRAALFLALGLAVLASAAMAQGGSNVPGTIGFGADQHSEFSLLLSGVWTANSGGPTIQHTATDSAAVQLGYRYRFDDWTSVEVDYGYTRNAQRYAAPQAEFSVDASLQQLMINDVIHLPRRDRKVQPFIFAGDGLAWIRPLPVGSVAYGTEREFGIDWGFGADLHLLHLGARLQFQGLDYRVPNFGNAALETNHWTQSSEPTAGLIFTF